MDRFSIAWRITAAMLTFRMQRAHRTGAGHETRTRLHDLWKGLRRLSTLISQKRRRYDRPEVTSAGAYHLAGGLTGQQHARETQLRWLAMDARDTREEPHR